MARAEASGLPEASVDLVTVAQALHWLDIPAFFAEARRVLAADGVLAVWGYARTHLSPEIDRVMNVFHDKTVGVFWPAERWMVEDGYRSVVLPFAELDAPRFVLEQVWTLDEFAGYVRTWSATQRYGKERGTDPVVDLVAALGPLWGAEGSRRVVEWPIHLRVGRARD